MAGRVRCAKYLLSPTAGQRQRLDHLLWMQRNLYNMALNHRRAMWEHGQHASRYDQFALLNNMAGTDLGRYGTCVARGTLTRVDLAFKAFFRRCRAGEAPGYPRFKARWRFNSVSWPDTSGWRLDASAKRFYAMGVGHVKLRLHRPLPGRPKCAHLRREGRRWWVVVVCDQVPAKPLPETGRVVGIDLGVASTLTTSDGTHVANPRPARKAQECLASAQRDLAPKAKGSKARRRAVERVAAHHRKIRNCRADHAHQLSRQLINHYDVVAHEDLRITNMVRSAKGSVDKPGTNVAAKSGLNGSIYDAGWGQLLSFVAYKAEEAGRTTIAVDPRHTSQTCARCGHTEAGNRCRQAVFRCLRCGHQAHADHNAAINILRAGLAQRALREVQKKTA